MHPPLTLQNNPQCVEQILAFKRCHAESTYMQRMLGECNEHKRLLDACFKAQKKVGLLSADLEASDFVLNDFIAEANNFDKAKVKADAEAYKLPDDLAAIDMAKVEAEFYNSAVN